MDEIQIFEKLNENMQNLENVENEISMLQLAIYQKNNEVFINNIYQLQIYEDNVFTKIKRIIFNKISGKSKFKRFLENYENEYIKDIKTKNTSKILDVISILKGIMKQMEKVKEQISVKYQKMIYN